MAHELAIRFCQFYYAHMIESMPTLGNPPNGETAMRTTLALDDELVAQAQAFTGLLEKSALIQEALKALIERESARRLALLGGSEPDLAAIPRR
jgi:Arc/MetJ family transcription regulator